MTSDTPHLRPSNHDVWTVLYYSCSENCNLPELGIDGAGLMSTLPFGHHRQCRRLPAHVRVLRTPCRARSLSLGRISVTFGKPHRLCLLFLSLTALASASAFANQPESQTLNIADKSLMQDINYDHRTLRQGLVFVARANCVGQYLRACIACVFECA
jgi:hypothetical protein